MHVLVPRLFSILYTNTPYSKFSIGIHYADSSSMGVVSSSLPVETSADVASTCFDRTGSVQLCSPYASIVAKAIAKRPQSAAGDCWQQRGEQVWL